MKASRRDFEEVARILGMQRAHYKTPQAWRDAVRAFCDLFAFSNPAFQREKFIRHCCDVADADEMSRS